MNGQYYRPTPGTTVGTWNLFHRDGDVDRDVPYAELPLVVQNMIRERFSRS